MEERSSPQTQTNHPEPGWFSLNQRQLIDMLKLSVIDDTI
jgi:hypothetical protein